MAIGVSLCCFTLRVIVPSVAESPFWGAQCVAERPVAENIQNPYLCFAAVSATEVAVAAAQVIQIMFCRLVLWFVFVSHLKQFPKKVVCWHNGPSQSCSFTSDV